MMRIFELIRLQTRFSGRSSRSRAVDRAYANFRAERIKRYGDDAPCPLCDDIANRVVVQSLPTLNVVENDFPYYIYSGKEVQSHLMMAPKRHIASFSDFTTEEQSDYWKTLHQYSIAGYDAVTTAADSPRRTVPQHLHTHLLRVRE